MDRVYFTACVKSGDGLLKRSLTKLEASVTLVRSMHDGRDGHSSKSPAALRKTLLCFGFEYMCMDREYPTTLRSETPSNLEISCGSFNLSRVYSSIYPISIELPLYELLLHEKSADVTAEKNIRHRKA